MELPRVTRDHIHHSFSPDHKPVLYVHQNETFLVETVDCFGGIVTPENPSADPAYETLNPVTGPIYIHGAEPGDILAVEILDIIPQGVGIARCGNSEGQLAHLISPSSNLCQCTRFFDLSDDGSLVTMRDHSSSENKRRISNISFSASPMLGVMGVAPKGGYSVSIPTMPAGMHGGNLDDRYNRKGSIVYFPVNQAGALLSIGDMHASQGDGEICGTGVEIRGEVRLKCKVIKKEDTMVPPSKLDDEHDKFDPLSEPCLFPVTETETHWHTHGVMVENIPGATIMACEEAARLLVRQWGFSMEDAFIFLSVKGNLSLCQSCHPDKGTQIARMSVPKIDACPHPFRCLMEKV
jgi:amidase